MRPNYIFAIFTPLTHAFSLEPTWIMSGGSQNLSRALQLSHPISLLPPTNDYIHVVPSNRSRYLYPEIPDDVWPALPYPGFWACPRSTSVPPNTEDCLQIINSTYRAFGKTTIDVPPSRCMQASYRSCLMYTCASSCDGVAWDMELWEKLAMHVQRSCVWGGYVQGLPRGKHDGNVFRTGLVHSDGRDTILTPRIVC